MKSSWVGGIVMFYIGLLFLSMVAEQNLSVNSSSMSIFSTLMHPVATDFSNPISALSSIWTDAWQYIKVFFQIVFLWFPNLWHGNWIWFYFFVCLPVTLMMIYSIMSMIRGTSTA